MKTTTFVSQQTGVVATVLGITLLLSMVSFAHADTLTRQLEVGSRGADVSSLQTFLAQDATIYPQGLVTGYFGFLTKSAVSNFQSNNGIDSVGRVGPVTLAAINAKMAGGMTDTTEGAGKVTYYDRAQPMLSGLAISTMATGATITWMSSVPATSRVMYSTMWPFAYRTASSVIGTSGTTGQSVTLTNLQPNTTYYYTIESLDAQGNFSWSGSGFSFKTN